MIRAFLIATIALAFAPPASHDMPVAQLLSEFAETCDTIGVDHQDDAQVRHHDLVVEVQQARAGVSITAIFRLMDSGLPGELQIDLWNAVDPTVAADLSIHGESHMRIHQARGDAEPHIWLSPTMEEELAHGEPDLMLVFLSVLNDPRFDAQVEDRLLTLPPDPQAKNPACRVTKWGLKALAWIAATACCKGVWAACAACVVGANTAVDAINGIDCNKECKPDCPIP